MFSASFPRKSVRKASRKSCELLPSARRTSSYLWGLAERTNCGTELSPLTAEMGWDPEDVSPISATRQRCSLPHTQESSAPPLGCSNWSQILKIQAVFMESGASAVSCARKNTGKLVNIIILRPRIFLAFRKIMFASFPVFLC